MKSTHWIAALFFSLFLAAAAAAGETIVIASGEYAPFTSKDAYEGGFVNHVVTEAFKLEGYGVKFDYLPWKRAKELTRKGNYIASSYWSCDENLKKDFLCSEQIKEGTFLLISLKSRNMKDWNTLEDLYGSKIGGTLGYGYTEEFLEAGKTGKFKLDNASKDIASIKKILKGRLDYFPIDEAVGYNLLRKQCEPGSTDLIRFHPRALNVTSSTLAFSQGHPDSEKMLKIFNAGLEKLNASGTLSKLKQDLLDGKYE